MSSEGRIFNKPFTILCIIIFITISNVAIFFPFQLYLRAQQIPDEMAGLIIGIFNFVSMCLQLFISPFLKNKDTKKIIIFGALLVTVSLISYNLFYSSFGLLVIRILHGMGFVLLLSAVMVTLVNFIPKEKSGKAFGIISIFTLLPYAVLPPVLGIFLKSSNDFPLSLLYLAAFSFMIVFLILSINQKTVQAESKTADKDFSWKSLLENFKNEKIVYLLLLNFLLYCTYAPIFYYLKEFCSGKNIENSGLFFTITTLTMIALRVFLGSYFDKVNKGKMILLSITGLILVFYILGFINNYIELLAIAFCFGILWGVLMPLLNSMIFDHSNPEFRGLNINLSMVMMQAGFFVGPTVAGMILSGFGYKIMFASFSLISLFSSLITIFIIKEKKI